MTIVWLLNICPQNRYYAWDFRVLKTFARHYSSGDVIPKALVDSMRGAKKMFSATELQRQVYALDKWRFCCLNVPLYVCDWSTCFPSLQIFYSLIDQKLFGEQPSSLTDTISLVAELKRQSTSWKHVDGTHWHTRFSHLASYGAGIPVLIVA